MKKQEAIHRFEGKKAKATDREMFQTLLGKVNLMNAKDCFRIGVCYDFGLGTKVSYKKAFDWYKKAAELEHSAAQYSLYVMYRDGEGVKRSLKTAMFWLKKAAKKKDGPALSDLGYAYFYGKGVSQNTKKAVELYKEAARKKIPRALYNLGLCYLDGTGVKVSYKKGKQLLERSLELGYYRSAFFLAEIYTGDCEPEIKKDYRKMCKYLRIARIHGVKDRWRIHHINKNTKSFVKANTAKIKNS